VSRLIALDQIEPNPDQPRRHFPEDHIRGLAASIKKRGLIQPISVRPIGKNRYQIVTGECRWRAHKLLGLPAIKCEVEDMAAKEMRLRAIVENVQRRDMNPIEEGNAFQSLIDDGMTVAQIADDLGLGSQLVQNRLDLLDLDESVQSLVATGSITASMAWAIRLAPRSQHTRIVREISSGNFKTVEQVRHACIAMRDADSQLDAFGEAPRASRKDVEAMRTLESKIDAISNMVTAGYKDGELIAARRVNPSRAKMLADKLSLIRKHVLQMEHDLRREAIAGQIQLDMVPT